LTTLSAVGEFIMGEFFIGGPIRPLNKVGAVAARCESG
jgi:hypothetical protein